MCIRDRVKKESDPTQLRLIIKNIKSQLDPKKFIFKSYPRIESYFYFILGFFYEREGDLSNAMANYICLLYTSDAADDLLCVDLGGRRIIKKKKKKRTRKKAIHI